MTANIEKSSSIETYSPFERVPDEILCNVLNFLDVGSIIKCSGTCKRLLQICSDSFFWKRFCERSTFVSFSRISFIVSMHFKKGVQEKKLICTRTLENKSLISSVVSYEKGKIISGSWDQKIKIWDIDSGVSIYELNGKNINVSTFACLDGNLISSSWDNKINVWDLCTEKRTQTLIGCTGFITVLGLAEDILISGSFDKIIRFWDLRSNKSTINLQGHKEPIKALTCGDGKIYSASKGEVKVWNVKSGTTEKTFPAPLNCTCFFYATGKVFTGTEEGSIKIWDTATNDFTFWTLEGHQDKIIGITGNCGKMVSGSRDKMIKIWEPDKSN